MKNEKNVMKRKASDLKVDTVEEESTMDVVCDDVIDISIVDEMDELVEMMSVSTCYVGAEEVMMLYDSVTYTYDDATIAERIIDAERRWRRYLFKLRSVYGCEAKRKIENGLQCIMKDNISKMDKFEKIRVIDGMILRMAGGRFGKKQRI